MHNIIYNHTMALKINTVYIEWHKTVLKPFQSYLFCHFLLIFFGISNITNRNGFNGKNPQILLFIDIITSFNSREFGSPEQKHNIPLKIIMENYCKPATFIRVREFFTRFARANISWREPVLVIWFLSQGSEKGLV